MNFDEMKEYEKFAGIKVNPPFIVRLDGWNFHELAKRLNFEVPFDEKFAKAMANTAAFLLKKFNAVVGYLFSDEINLLFEHTPFTRLEKVDSILAALASSKLTIELKCNEPIAMDCRIVAIPKEKIDEYFSWRKAECLRNHHNAYAYWLLRKHGLSPMEAQKKLHGLGREELVKLCAKLGVDLNKTPKWQREGIWVRWQEYEKRGYNPLVKRHEIAKRRKVMVEFQQ